MAVLHCGQPDRRQLLGHLDAEAQPQRFTMILELCAPFTEALVEQEGAMIQQVDQAAHLFQQRPAGGGALGRAAAVQLVQQARTDVLVQLAAQPLALGFGATGVGAVRRQRLLEQSPQGFRGLEVLGIEQPPAALGSAQHQRRRAVGAWHRKGVAFVHQLGGGDVRGGPRDLQRREGSLEQLPPERGGQGVGCQVEHSLRGLGIALCAGLASRGRAVVPDHSLNREEQPADDRERRDQRRIRRQPLQASQQPVQQQHHAGREEPGPGAEPPAVQVEELVARQAQRHAQVAGDQQAKYIALGNQGPDAGEQRKEQGDHEQAGAGDPGEQEPLQRRTICRQFGSLAPLAPRQVAEQQQAQRDRQPETEVVVAQPLYRVQRPDDKEQQRKQRGDAQGAQRPRVGPHHRHRAAGEHQAAQVVEHREPVEQAALHRQFAAAVDRRGHAGQRQAQARAEVPPGAGMRAHRQYDRTGRQGGQREQQLQPEQRGQVGPRTLGFGLDRNPAAVRQLQFQPGRAQAPVQLRLPLEEGVVAPIVVEVVRLLEQVLRLQLDGRRALRAQGPHAGIRRQRHRRVLSFHHLQPVGASRRGFQAESQPGGLGGQPETDPGFQHRQQRDQGQQQQLESAARGEPSGRHHARAPRVVCGSGAGPSGSRQCCRTRPSAGWLHSRVPPRAITR